jgi:hypothetical protein
MPLNVCVTWLNGRLMIHLSVFYDAGYTFLKNKFPGTIVKNLVGS